MPKKKNAWKAWALAGCCLLVGAGLTVGTTALVKHFQDKPSAEQTEEEKDTTTTTPETPEETVQATYVSAIEAMF